MRGHTRKRGRKWSVVVDVGRDETGKRKQRWHSGYETKKEAETALAEILGKMQRGEYVQPSKRTLANFLNEWMNGQRSHLKPGTWQSYKTNVDAYIIPRLGTLKLQDITPGLLDAFYAELETGGRRARQGGLSRRTVRFTHAIIRKALSDAVRQNQIPRNPAELARPPKHETPEMRTWNAEELTRFLSHVKEDRYFAAYRLAAMTGLRRGELLGLRWGDVDVEAGRLSVRQALLSVRNKLIRSTPKTGKGRSVSLDPETVAALRQWKTRQAKERLAFEGEWPDHDLVFTREDGEPVHPDRFSRDWFAQHVKAAGLRPIRLHDLRHTHATLALQAGIHPKQVSSRLGHATVSITLDIYSHAVPEMDEEAAVRVAALVGS